MSSAGFLIESEHKLDAGIRLQVTIDWPALLEGAVGLVLVTVGRVVWTGQSSFAFAFSQYGFRTTARKFGASTPAPHLASAASGRP